MKEEEGYTMYTSTSTELFAAEILELHPVGDSTESAGDGVSSHALV